jgi:hypothetical protein
MYSNARNTCQNATIVRRYNIQDVAPARCDPDRDDGALRKAVLLAKRGKTRASDDAAEGLADSSGGVVVV